MKVIGLLCLLLTRPAAAQNWFPQEAEWHYSYANGAGEGYVRIAVVGDTSVVGRSCQILSRTRQVYDHFTDQFHTDSLGSIFAYGDSSSVMVYVPELNDFDTLYQMDAAPGARWGLPALPQPIACDPSSYMQVTDTGTRILDGVPLHWLSVDIHYSMNDVFYEDPDTIVQRMGTVGQYLLPYDFCNGFVDGQEGGAFRCYQDNEISYQSAFAPECDLIVGIGEHAIQGSITIYPDPGTDHLTVVLPDRPLANRMLFYDAMGQRALSVPLLAEQTRVNASMLAPGLYAYHIVDAAGRTVNSGTWVKQ